MSKIYIDQLNHLFNLTDHRQDTVLWIRSADYQRQLYVSPNYEFTWGQPEEQIYKSPESWNDYLYQDDYSYIFSKLSNRTESQTIQDNKLLFRIQSKKGDIKHIIDHPYTIVDRQENVIAFSGISEVISENNWHALRYQTELNTLVYQKENHYKQISHALNNELIIRGIANSTATDHQLSQKYAHPLFKVKPHGNILSLSVREAECLLHLFQGKLAKQTAAIMNISSRTVEFHLNNIKIKAGCRNKLELLSRITLA